MQDVSTRVERRCSERLSWILWCLTFRELVMTTVRSRILRITTAHHSHSSLDGWQISGNDLRLVAEHVSTVGIDQNLEPLHVGVIRFRVVAEGLDAREVLQAAAE